MAQFSAFEEAYDFEWDVGGRIPFYLDLARKAGGPVAEFACGTGRILLPIARDELQTWGVECAGPMAVRFGRRLVDEDQEVRKRVHLVEADPVRADLEQRFALVMVAFGGAQLYLDDETFEALMENLARHTEPGGLLAFDLMTLDQGATERPGLVRHMWTKERPKDRETVSRFEVLTEGSTPDRLDLTIFLDTVDETDHITRRVVKQELRRIDREDIEPLLSDHGFELVDVFGDAQGAEFDRSSDRMFVVARRSG